MANTVYRCIKYKGSSRVTCGVSYPQLRGKKNQPAEAMKKLKDTLKGTCRGLKERNGVSKSQARNQCNKEVDNYLKNHKVYPSRTSAANA